MGVTAFTVHCFRHSDKFIYGDDLDAILLKSFFVVVFQPPFNTGMRYAPFVCHTKRINDAVRLFNLNKM